MLSWRSVETDFSKVILIRHKLRSGVDEMIRICEEIEGYRYEINNVWREESKDHLMTKLFKVNEEGKREVEEINQIVMDLEKTSNTLFKSETNNIQIGCLRRY